MTEPKNDFDVAKSLCELLGGLEKERQHRILRWVAESLELALHVKTPGSILPKADPPSADMPALPTQRTPDPPAERAADIKTFVGLKKPKSDVQYAAVVAYYYRFEAPEEHRKETITADMLQESTRLAGRTRLSQPLKTLNNSKGLGYLDSSGRGAFKLNTVGENLVAMTLPGKNGKEPQ